MRRGALILIALLGLILGWNGSAAAQQTPPPMGGVPASTATVDVESPSLLGQLTNWILVQQRVMHRELVRGLRTLSQTHALQAVWALILGSFLYGVFHAVGPGHGKAIIATYLATQPYRMSRGLWLSAGGAYAQGVVAIAVVYGLVIVAGWLPRDTQAAVNWSERASFALVILIGAGLAWRAMRSLFGGDVHGHGHDHAPEHAHAHDQSHAHDHGHAHDHAHTHDHGHEPGHHHKHAVASDPHPHAAHVHDEHCGHVHAPSDAMIEKAVDWRSTLAIIATIGMRPCSGAILVLVLATTLDLNWAGVAAVFAMSTGTAIALGIIGVIVIQARSWAVGALGGNAGGRIHLLSNGLALVGGCAVALLGASLLAASFGPAHPLGL